MWKSTFFNGEPLDLKCWLTLLDHLRASSWSCLAATIMGSFTISPAFCSGNSSSFSSGGGGLGGGTSPSGRGGLGGAASSLSYKGIKVIMVWFGQFKLAFQIHSYAYPSTYIKLIHVWRWGWWELWLLRLKCLLDLCHSTKNLITRVKKALMKTWELPNKHMYE